MLVPLERIIFGILLTITVCLGRTCRDGWGNSGVCINLRSCTPILRLLRPVDPVTGQPVERDKEDVTRIRASICPSQSRGIYVCCAPPTPPPTTTTTTTTAAPTPAPIDLSRFDPSTPEGNPKRLLLPPAPSCGQTLITERIVGGEEAIVGEFPWLALLGYEDAQHYDYDYSYGDEGAAAEDEAAEEGEPPVKFSCGGVLINQRYVVTAAHCVVERDGTPLKVLKVRLGEHNLGTERDCQYVNQTGETYCNAPPLDVKIERIVAHADYMRPKRNKNDIALVRLAKPVTYTDWIRPICLPFEEWRSDDPPGTAPWVAGFGLTQPFGDSSPSMQKLRVPMYNKTRCARRFSRQRIDIGAGQLCAGGQQGKDSCDGDSGGPLMQHARYGPPYYLRGVVSFGDMRCGNGRPGVYTDVPYYMAWILENLAP